MLHKIGRMNRKGMSMLTALAALIILSIAVLQVAQVFLTAMKNNGSAAGVTGLMNLAQAMSEKIMLLPDNDPLLYGSNISSPGTVNLRTPEDYNATLYQLKSCTLTPIPAIDPRLVRVEIVTDYTDAFGALLGVKPTESEVRIITYRFHE